jgi:hypothetical protein
MFLTEIGPRVTMELIAADFVAYLFLLHFHHSSEKLARLDSMAYKADGSPSHVMADNIDGRKNKPTRILKVV